MVRPPMTVIVYTQDARSSSPSGERFVQLLEAVDSRFTNTFVLAVCREAPAETAPHPRRDWVRLSEVFTEAQLPRVLSELCVMHQAPAWIEVHDGSAAALLPPEGLAFAGELTAEGSIAELLDSLDSCLPFARVVGPKDELDTVRSELAARPSAPELHLYWKGGLVRELLELVRGVLEADPRPLRLQLGLSEAVRGAARRLLLSLPAEAEIRIVAEDEYTRGAAAGAEALLRSFRRERPRSRTS